VLGWPEKHSRLMKFVGTLAAYSTNPGLKDIKSPMKVIPPLGQTHCGHLSEDTSKGK
jgi:hypothetical protein